jgi:hypothetical protein
MKKGSKSKDATAFKIKRSGWQCPNCGAVSDNKFMPQWCIQCEVGGLAFKLVIVTLEISKMSIKEAGKVYVNDN